MAAEKESTGGYYNVGYCYEYGKGVSKDISIAISYYKKAAAKGHNDSKERLKKLGY